MRSLKPASTGAVATVRRWSGRCSLLLLIGLALLLALVPTTVLAATPPVANDDSYGVAEGGTLNVPAPGVLGNDTDAETDPLTAIKVSDPLNGSLTLNADGSFTYVHNGSETTSDSFTYKANDGSADSNVATVNITITPVNDAPVAQGQTLTTDEDTALAITLRGSDAETCDLAFSIVTQPSHGALSAITDQACTSSPNADTAQVMYTPAANYNGPDSFTFKVNDGTVDSNTATVSITVNAVNDAPVADAKSETTNEDTAKVITLSGSDVETCQLTFTIVTQPSNGTLSAITNQPCSAGAPNTDTAQVTYTPNANYNGPDSFTYRVSDGAVNSSAATVNITVNAVNDAPVADARTAATDEDVATVITLSGSDVDNCELTFSIIGNPSHGSLGAITNQPCVAGAPNTDTAQVTYTPAANYNGPDSFTYRVNDGTVDSNTATVSITVNAVNDAPVADAKSETTNEDTAKVITLSGSDVETCQLTFTIVTQPSNGTLSAITNQPCAAGTPNRDTAQVTYTPNANYNGPDSFTFKVNDGTVDSNTATVSITVNAVNDAPTVANPIADVTVDEDALDFVLDVSLVFDDLDIATNADSLTLSVQANDNPTLVTATLNGAILTLDFAADQNGVANITIRATDLAGAFAEDTFLVTVNAVNDAPVVANPIADVTVDEDAPNTVLDLSVVFADVDIATGDSLTLSVQANDNPTLVSATLNGSSLTLDFLENQFGQANVTIRATDLAGAFVDDTFRVTVNPVNDPPETRGQSVVVLANTASVITLSATDVDNCELAFLITNSPKHGVLQVTAQDCVPGTSSNTDTARVTYTPDLNYFGPDSFSYRVSDGLTTSGEAIVTIEVIDDRQPGPTFTVTVDDDLDKDVCSAGDCPMLAANSGVCSLVHCSLREAINAANANPGRDTIEFRIPGSGLHTIQPTSLLPEITSPVVIDGTTQTGTRLIELDGSNVGVTANGLVITAGQSTVRGLVINRFSRSGIRLATNGGNVIAGNLIGTDATGKRRLGNGVYGVEVHESSANVIGGVGPGEGNVISANGLSGIFIAGSNISGRNAADNRIQGNFIGTNGHGDDLRNTLHGVHVTLSARDNIIGGMVGTTPGGACTGACNVIAFNGGDGVFIQSGSGNAVLSNSIFANGDQGVDLAPGANINQAAPTLVRAGVDASSGQVTVRYRVDTSILSPSSLFPLRVEFFSADAGGQTGKTFLGHDSYDPRNLPGGFKVFQAVLPNAGSIAALLATASDARGNTSRFSQSIQPNVAGATFTVNSTADRSDRDLNDEVCNTRPAGEPVECTLRAAIEQANFSIGGVDTIAFDVPASDAGLNLDTGVASILPRSQLPTISGPVVIDGSTQPGFEGAPLIELDGSLAGPKAIGLHLTAGGSTVRGLAINRFDNDGLRLETGGNNVVQGNFIGVNAAGTGVAPNGGNGIRISRSPANVIGGAAAGERNVISGNALNGVAIFGIESVGNILDGNSIGTDATGTRDLGNAANGIYVEDGSSTTIGRKAAVSSDQSTVTYTGAGNIIAFNRGNGVTIHSGAGNAIHRNVMLSNRGLGIDLGNNGRSSNDAGDADAGPNRNQNSPALDFSVIIAPSWPLFVCYLVDSATASSTYPLVVEFYRADAAGDEGMLFLGSDVYVASKARSHDCVDLGSAVKLNVVPGDRIVAVATDGGNNTSEFSIAVDVKDGFSSVAPAASASAATMAGAATNDHGDAGMASVSQAASPQAVVVDGPAFTVNSTGDEGDSNRGDGLCSIGRLTSTGARICTLRAAIEEANANPDRNTIRFDISVVQVYRNDFEGTVGFEWTDRKTDTTPIGNRRFLGQFGNGGPGLGLGNLPAHNRVAVLFDLFIIRSWDGNSTGAGPDRWRLFEEFSGILIGTTFSNTSSNQAFGCQGGNCAPRSGAAESNTLGYDFFGDTVYRLGVNFPHSNSFVGLNFTASGLEPIGNESWGLDNVKVEVEITSRPATFTIKPGSALPEITRPVIIDGTTQPGFGGAPIIELDGRDTTSSANGLRISAGSSTVRGLVINGFKGNGILLLKEGDNFIEGNFIGTDTSGTKEPGNQGYGVLIDGSPRNTIGGTISGTRNLISGNALGGVGIIGSASVGNQVKGNFIGTDASGTKELRNRGNGVYIQGASNNAIVGNLIAFNEHNGVSVASGAGNAINRNVMFSNRDLGIDLGNNGLTPNDAGDADAGANNLQNSPVLSFAIAIPASGLAFACYIVDSDTSRSGYPLAIEFFKADGDREEGASFLGSDVYVASRARDLRCALLENPSSVPVAQGDRIVATATDSAGNTSEFSAALEVKNISVGSFGRTYTVNSTGDAADRAIGDRICNTKPPDEPAECTLRAAIQEANALVQPGGFPSLDRIAFGIPASDPGFNPSTGAFTIRLSSALPTVSSSAIIDGTTQPGFLGAPLIEMDGRSAGPDASGLRISSGNSRVQGLVINSFTRDGILLETNGSNIVTGNFIGTDVTGALGRQNAGAGVRILDSSKNTIGGEDAGARNLISGNGQQGVIISGSKATRNVVKGNFIGVNKAGTAAIRNGFSGVRIEDASDNTVGGVEPGAGNLISGNNEHGVFILKLSGSQAQVTGNVVLGNLIGTDASGAANIGNAGAGVRIEGASRSVVGGTVGTIPGGACAGACNVIAFNGGDGVFVHSGSDNSILSNSIFSNTNRGIELAPNANTNEASPLLQSARIDAGGKLAIKYSVVSQPRLRVEFFKAAPGEEGKVFLGSDEYAAPGTKTAILGAAASLGVQEGDFIVATATDTSGNTSEFSGSSPVGIAGRITVNSTGDSGDLPGDEACNTGNLVGEKPDQKAECTLRAAIELANFIDGADTIVFSIPPEDTGINQDTGAIAIQLQSRLPTITGPLTIDGASQPGVTLDGSRTAPFGIAGPGLHIAGAGGSVVTGLVIKGFGGPGILIESSNNVIGGLLAGTANAIARNSGDGVSVKSGAGNAILSNAISGNGGEAIDLGDNGSTPNDSLDADAGPNNLQNFPILRSARADANDMLVIEYSTDSHPNNSTYPLMVQFFRVDPAGVMTFLAADTYTADDFNVVFKVVEFDAPGLTDQDTIVATATDDDGQGNTSEVSPALPVAPLIPFVVNSTGDGADSNQGDGLCNTGGKVTRDTVEEAECTLRAAIQQANAIDGADKIVFNIPGGGPHTIAPAQPLPQIDSPVVIDGATQAGVTLDGSQAAGASGLMISLIGNSTVRGLTIRGFGENGILITSPNNTIGGVRAGDGNTITANGRNGVSVASGVGNAILGNSIFGNGGLGIDLGDDGPNVNDSLDSDIGPNNLQNAPTLVATRRTSSGDLEIEYSVESAPGSSAYPIRVEFFRVNPAGETSFLGHDVYEQAEAQAIAVANLGGIPLDQNESVVATATDANGNTSEFSGSRAGPGDADLSVDFENSPGTATPGAQLSYTVVVANAGPAAANNVRLEVSTDPAALTFGQAAPSQGSCDRSGGVLTCNLGGLAVGAEARVTIGMTAPSSGTVRNRAEVTANERDTVQGNNLKGVDTSISAPPPPPGGGGGGGGGVPGPAVLPPSIALGQSSFEFEATQNGANPASQTLTFLNNGGASVGWSVSDNAPWLIMTPASGAFSPGESASVSLAVNITGLVSGTYAATITVAAPGAVNTPQTAQVTLVLLAPPPEIGANPASLSFTAVSGGQNPAPRTLEIRNAGGRTLEWALTADVPWLAMNPTGGTSTTERIPVSVSVDIAGLSVGTHEAIIEVSAPGATNTPRQVRVELVIQPPPPAISLSRDAIAVAVGQGDPNPTPRTLEIRNSGGRTLRWSASASEGATWLVVSPASGASTGEANVLTLAINSLPLTRGVFEATVEVASPDATNSPQRVRVTLNVGDPTDSDSDGVPNIVEDLAPNGGDGNGDGVRDSIQPNVVSVPDLVEGLFATLSAQASVAFSGVQSIENPSAGDAPAGVVFPMGFHAFTLGGLTRGQAIQVSLRPDPARGVRLNTFFKFGPTPDNPSPHWYEFAFDGQTGAEVRAGEVIIHLVDGGRGDDDLSANGRIAARGAAALDLRADLSLARTQLPETRSVVQNIEYSFTIRNKGPSDAANVTLTEPVSGTVVAVTPSQGACAPGNGVDCNLGVLASGASATVTVILRPAAAGELILSASARSGNVDPTMADNAVTSTVAVTAPVIAASVQALAFTAVEGNPNPRDSQVQVRNTGTGAPRWTVTDACPATNERVTVAPWLRLSPTSGTATSEASALTVSVDVAGLEPGTHESQFIISAPEATNACLKVAVTLNLLAAAGRPVQSSVNLPRAEREGLGRVLSVFLEAQRSRVTDPLVQQWLSETDRLSKSIESELTALRPLEQPTADRERAYRALRLLSGALASWGPSDSVPDAIGQATLDMAKTIAAAIADEARWSDLGILRMESTGRVTLLMAYSRAQQKVILHVDFFDPVPGQIDAVIPVSAEGGLLRAAGDAEVFARRVPMVRASIQSPGELRVYDEVGRISGIVNGRAFLNIPGSTLLGSAVLVLLPSESHASTLRYEIAGTEQGLYGLRITLLSASAQPTDFARDGVAITPRAVHLYSVDWPTLSEATGWSRRIDENGDGVFESEFPPRLAERSGPPAWVWPEAIVAAIVVLVILAVAAYFLVSLFRSGRLAPFAKLKLPKLPNVKLPK